MTFPHRHSGTIGGRGLGGLEPLEWMQVKTYGTGRTCAVCGTPLSRYNPDPVCWTHRHEADKFEKPDRTEPVTDPAFVNRRCTKCGTSLPFTAEYFGRDKSMKSGLRGVCKRCINERNKRRYEDDPEAAQRRRESLRRRYLNPERRAKELEWQRKRREKARLARQKAAM